MGQRAFHEMILEPDLTGADLAQRILRYAADPAALEAMAARARGMGRRGQAPGCYADEEKGERTNAGMRHR